MSEREKSKASISALGMFPLPALIIFIRTDVFHFGLFLLLKSENPAFGLLVCDNDETACKSRKNTMHQELKLSTHPDDVGFDLGSRGDFNEESDFIFVQPQHLGEECGLREPTRQSPRYRALAFSATVPLRSTPASAAHEQEGEPGARERKSPASWTSPAQSIIMKLS
ncbi:hypothetical protein DL765_007780 [Monosporascus sp. GIB2]|nr:hypothetical protein DL765_007780 [Monosporascus sp. GIB2]